MAKPKLGAIAHDNLHFKCQPLANAGRWRRGLSAVRVRQQCRP